MDKSVRTYAESREESGSLDLASIFVEALAEARSPSDQKARDVIAKAFDYLSRRIQKDAFANDSFKKLSENGCEAQELLWLLAACSEGPSAEPNRVSLIMGSDSRKLKAIVRKFRGCAAQIEAINSARVGLIFNRANLPLPYMLPVGLRQFAALADFIAQLRWETYWTVAKKQLIHYVKQKTGHYHDKLVAQLIATATDRHYYDQKDHSRWRLANRTAMDRLPLPRTESVSLAGMARPVVRTTYSMCIYALLLKLSDRGESAPPKPLTKLR